MASAKYCAELYVGITTETAGIGIVLKYTLELGVNRFVRMNHILESKASQDPFSPRPGHRLTTVGILKQADDGVRQRPSVGWRHQDAVTTILHDLRNASDSGCYNRSPKIYRFRKYKPECLSHTRKNNQIRGLYKISRVLAEANK